MTHAAVYARKSNDQPGIPEDRSVARQVESAKAYAAKKGWIILPDHIFIDDGILGAADRHAILGAARGIDGLYLATAWPS